MFYSNLFHKIKLVSTMWLILTYCCPVFGVDDIIKKNFDNNPILSPEELKTLFNSYKKQILKEKAAALKPTFRTKILNNCI